MSSQPSLRTVVTTVLAVLVFPCVGIAQSPVCHWGSSDYAWVADFDGDGTADIASAQGGLVHMHFSRGDKFANRTWVVPATWGGSGYTWVADFDGDGRADIASANGGDIYMHLSRDDGFSNSTWQVPGNWGSAEYSWTGDFDGDGRADIASANGGSVHMHRSQGDKFLNQTWEVPNAWGSAGYTWAADFDGDGNTDIASANGGAVYMHLSQGDGFLNQTWSVPGAWGSAGYTWAADFDGDGDADIASAYGGNVYMHLSSGDGFDSQTWTVPGAWGGSEYTWVADFNGDGRADIASANGGNVYMHLSNGAGFDSQTWAVPNEWGGSGYTWVADFDGDGVADIASATWCIVHMRLSANGLFNNETWYSSPDRPNGEVLSTVLQPDGKILIGGSFNLIGERPGIGIARLNADGSLDTGFNAVVNGSVNAIAVQPDGKVLVGGHFGSVGGQPRIGVARLNPDGSLDATFDTRLGARAAALLPPAVPWSDTNPHVNSILVQPDGKILIGGAFESVGGPPCIIGWVSIYIFANRIDPNCFDSVGLARLNPDGSLDSVFDRVTFDGPLKLSGINVWFTSAETPQVTSLAVLPDGRFLVGSVDREIDVHAQRRGFPLGGSIFLLDPDFDRRRQLAASSLPPPSKWKWAPGPARSFAPEVAQQFFEFLESFTADGPVKFLAYKPPVTSITLQSDGKILIGGPFDSVHGQRRVGVARLNPDGSLDPGFDVKLDAQVNSIALQPDGKIVIGGTFNSVGGQADTSGGRGARHSHVGIARLNPDGSLDLSFDPKLNAHVNAIVVRPDGKILVSGAFTSVGGRLCHRIALLNPDGSLDTDF